jgi:hypothetical protein
MVRDLPDLSGLAVAGTEVSCRVTPKAARDRVEQSEDGSLRVYVTAIPDKGAANAAVIKLLAKAMGVPKSRLAIIRGMTSRDKVLRLS